MERIEPGTFFGPRTYFTHFDYRIVARTRNRDRLAKLIERRLKILLLTKSTVVCAASHLTSSFTFDIFRHNPVLLEESLIVPALRRDKESLDDLWDKKRTPKKLKAEMLGFYRGEVRKVVNWDLVDNSKWFRDSMLSQVTESKSVLRRNLLGLSGEQIRSLTDSIAGKELLEREQLEAVSNGWSLAQRRALLNFRDLLYHISGARVVNAESALPQENYIDYSLSDVEHHRIILSDWEVFWKLFVELAFESFNKYVVPVELLDALTFDDVLALRKVIDNSDFREKYDALIQEAICSVVPTGQATLLYTAEQLLAIRDKVAAFFRAVFEKELQAFLRRKAVSSAGELGKSTSDSSSGCETRMLITP